MTSSVTNYSNFININFPVPGADNDTQEFRSNFSRIQNAFTVVSDELTNLQINSVNLSSTNDFGYNVVKKPALQAEGHIVNDVSAAISAGNIPIDFALGTYQRYQINSGTNTLSIANWPSGSADDIVGKIRLELQLVSSFPTSIIVSGATMISHNSTPVVYNSVDTVIWDVWSPDGGTTVYAAEVNPTHIQITGNGDVYTTAGTTGMTNGFFFIPAASGAPSGTPATILGTVAMYYDTTNNHFYIYNGAWRKVTLS